MLDQSFIGLANTTEVSISTIRRIEGGLSEAVLDDFHLVIRTTLEIAGLRFSLKDERGEGVWFDRG